MDEKLPRFAFEAAVVPTDGAGLAVIASRWDDAGEVVSLVELRQPPELVVIVDLPIGPLQTRGLAQVGDHFEVMTTDCQALIVCGCSPRPS